jgi:hypothetical protein
MLVKFSAMTPSFEPKRYVWLAEAALIRRLSLTLFNQKLL